MSVHQTSLKDYKLNKRRRTRQTNGQTSLESLSDTLSESIGVIKSLTGGIKDFPSLSYEGYSTKRMTFQILRIYEESLEEYFSRKMKGHSIF